jgi:hypothetical protein
VLSQSFQLVVQVRICRNKPARIAGSLPFPVTESQNQQALQAAWQTSLLRLNRLALGHATVVGVVAGRRAQAQKRENHDQQNSHPITYFGRFAYFYKIRLNVNPPAELPNPGPTYFSSQLVM